MVLVTVHEMVIGMVSLGAEYLSPKKVSLLNSIRFILNPKP